jgi:hypothetical protein
MPHQNSEESDYKEMTKPQHEVFGGLVARRDLEHRGILD